MENTATGVSGDLIFKSFQININASTEEWLGSVLTNPFLCDRGNMSLENALFLLITILSDSRAILSLMCLQNTSAEHFCILLPLNW